MTPWTAVHQASLSLTVSQSLLKLMSIELVMPSNHSHPLSPPSPPALHLSQHQVFSNESALCIRWPKYWGFSFSISSSNEYSGLIPLQLTSLISLQSKRFSRVFSSTTVQKHQFCIAQPSLSSMFTAQPKLMTPYMFACKTEEENLGTIVKSMNDHRTDRNPSRT